MSERRSEIEMPKFTLEVKVSDNNCSVSCCKNNTQGMECAGVSVSQITAVDGAADSEEKESCCMSCHIVKYYRNRRKRKQQQQQQREDEAAEKVQSTAEENL